jgi:hypothetical protein
MTKAILLATLMTFAATPGFAQDFCAKVNTVLAAFDERLQPLKGASYGVEDGVESWDGRVVLTGTRCSVEEEDGYLTYGCLNRGGGAAERTALLRAVESCGFKLRGRRLDSSRPRLTLHRYEILSGGRIVTLSVGEIQAAGRTSVRLDLTDR